MNKQMFLIGGNFFSDEGDKLIDKLSEMVGGKDKVKLGVFTETSYFSRESYKDHEINFMDNGIRDVSWIKITDSNKESLEIEKQILSRNIIYFAGGSQERSLFGVFYKGSKNDKKYESNALKVLRKAVDEGKIILAGNSAGSMIMQNEYMITGGESYEAILYGCNNIDDYIDLDDTLTVDNQGGLAFFNYGVIDTHFSWRGRQGRLSRVVADYKIKGFGIDNSTAMYINITDNSRKVNVYGEGGVYIIDGSHAVVHNKKIENVLISKITEGDVYDLDSGEIIFKNPPSTDKLSVLSSRDIFSSPNNRNIRDERKNPDEFERVCRELVLSDASKIESITYEHPRVIVSVRKNKDTIGYGNSYCNVVVDYYW
jgi:cyanophycinase